MTEIGKIRTTSVLMLLGLAPLALGASWITAALASLSQHRGNIGGSDAFLMMAVIALTYFFAAVVSGPSALWAARLLKRNPDMRATFTSVSIRVVGVVLALPLLGYAILSLPPG